METYRIHIYIYIYIQCGARYTLYNNVIHIFCQHNRLNVSLIIVSYLHWLLKQTLVFLLLFFIVFFSIFSLTSLLWHLVTCVCLCVWTFYGVAISKYHEKIKLNMAKNVREWSLSVRVVYYFLFVLLFFLSFFSSNKNLITRVPL